MKKIPTCAFGLLLLAALARADDNLADAYAFPVPYRPSIAQHITFTNLPASATVRIYTLKGDLVRKLNNNDFEIRWDVNNEDGTPVASGVYIYLIESGDQKKRGKLLVVR